MEEVRRGEEEDEEIRGDGDHVVHKLHTEPQSDDDDDVDDDDKISETQRE